MAQCLVRLSKKVSLQTDSKGAEVMETERLFQTLGPATTNDRSRHWLDM